MIPFFFAKTVSYYQRKTKEARARYPATLLKHIFKLINKRASNGYTFAIHDCPSWLNDNQHSHILSVVEKELRRQGFDFEYTRDQHKFRIQIYWF